MVIHVFYGYTCIIFNVSMYNYYNNIPINLIGCKVRLLVLNKLLVYIYIYLYIYYIIIIIIIIIYILWL